MDPTPTTDGLDEVVAALATRKRNLEAVIASHQKQRDANSRAIREARAELDGVDRMLRARTPRTRKPRAAGK